MLEKLGWIWHSFYTILEDRLKQDVGHDYRSCGRGLPLTLVCLDAYHNRGAEVAQLVEHSTENAGVVSSILTLGTFGGR